jgi:hypothetical protein
VIALEIEIGSGGKQWVVGVYIIRGSPEYYPILFYKLHHPPRFEVFFHYYLSGDFLALLFSNERLKKTANAHYTILIISHIHNHSYDLYPYRFVTTTVFNRSNSSFYDLYPRIS